MQKWCYKNGGNERAEIESKTKSLGKKEKTFRREKWQIGFNADNERKGTAGEKKWVKRSNRNRLDMCTHTHESISRGRACPTWSVESGYTSWRGREECEAKHDHQLRYLMKRNWRTSGNRTQGIDRLPCYNCSPTGQPGPHGYSNYDSSSSLTSIAFLQVDQWRQWMGVQESDFVEA